MPKGQNISLRGQIQCPEGAILHLIEIFLPYLNTVKKSAPVQKNSGHILVLIFNFSCKGPKEIYFTKIQLTIGKGN